jgi:hypothetical protein
MKNLAFTLAMSLLSATVLFTQHVVAQSNATYTVGEEVPITLTARDSLGNVITDYNLTGEPITLTLLNSTANTDTSLQSWNNDSWGYTWAYFQHDSLVLNQISDNEFYIKPSLFIDGVVTVELVHSKADTGVYFYTTPIGGAVDTVSEKMDFVPGKTSQLAIDITWPKPNQRAVYLWREYEFVYTPRDTYTNIAEDTLRVQVWAKFAGEWSPSPPPIGWPWDGIYWPHGITPFTMVSITERGLDSTSLQEIYVRSMEDSTLYARSGIFEVLPHAPSVFNLLTPPDSTTLQLQNVKTPYQFKWAPAIDPYTNIKLSAFNDDTASDVVTYMICMVDSTNLTQKVSIDSDNLGHYPIFTTIHGQLRGIAEQLTQGSPPPIVPVYWYVEATDGLYITQNRPALTAEHQMARLLWLDLSWIPDDGGPPPDLDNEFTLHQNFPNPIGRSIENSGTMMTFETVNLEHVSLVVYDMLGHKVATIIDEILEPGLYKKWLVTRDLPSGVYHYALSAGGKVLIKSMVIGK